MRPSELKTMSSTSASWPASGSPICSFVATFQRRIDPSELADAKLLMLVDRTSGGMLGVALFDTEEEMRKADEAMNAGPGNAGSRTSVEFYEVPLHTL